MAKPNSNLYQARILSIVAIGGMGKSALTWKWFNDIAPNEMKQLAGRLWQSFYESDATFENFVIRALAQLPVFHTFDSHPLLIQALAGEVSHDRRTPGDFDSWRKNHPDFNPFNLPIVQVKSHVLEFALRGLDETNLKLLHTIAAFRIPAAYDTLLALLVGEDKPCTSENELITILADLEDRGLLGWDRRAKRYDLHPIVRGVTWSGLSDQVKHDIYVALYKHFMYLPNMINRMSGFYFVSGEDLTAAIELYITLIGLRRYDDAWNLLDNLEPVMMQHMAATDQFIELLELLFPDGLDQFPRTSSTSYHQIFHSMGMGYRFYGQLMRASVALRNALVVDKDDIFTLYFLAETLRLSGAIYNSEAFARQGLLLAQKRGIRSNELRS